MPVEVICGCMYSGKSEELGQRLLRLALVKKKIRIFVPEEDTRRTRNIDAVVAQILEKNSKLDIPKSIRIKSPNDILNFVTEEIKVVAVDETQFFHTAKDIEECLDVLEKLRKGRIILISGLDTDFRHRPFGVMPYILAVADQVRKLTAICFKCQDAEATFTQRLIDGKPAPKNSPLISIEHKGDNESYEARCGNCYE